MTKVDDHFAQACHWALSVDEAPQMMCAVLAGCAGADLLLDGINPNGSVD